MTHCHGHGGAFTSQRPCLLDNPDDNDNDMHAEYLPNTFMLAGRILKPKKE